MVVELVIILTMTLAGWSVAMLAGLDRINSSATVLGSPLLGTAVSVLASAVMLALGFGIQIWLHLAVLGVLLFAAAVHLIRAPTPWRPLILLTQSMVVAGSSIALLSASLRPVLTHDSYRFIMLGRMASAGDLEMSEAMLADYPIGGIQLQFLAAALEGEFLVYTAPVAGLLGLIGGVLLILNPDREPIPRGITFALSVASAMIVATSYMLRLQLSLLNSHVMVAGFVTFGAAIALAPLHRSSRRPVLMTSALMLGALALSRAEGPFIVALILIALAASETAHKRDWVPLSLIVLAPALIWYLRMIQSGGTGEILSPARVVVLLVAIAAPIVLISTTRLAILRQHTAALSTGAATAVLILVAVIKPDGTAVSTAHLISNLSVSGLWGVVWWLVLPLAGVLAIAAPPIRNEKPWLIVLLGFAVLIVVLGAVRDFPYRLGFGDSGNRMATHILGLAIGFVIAKMRPRPDDATQMNSST